jgi:hypothetical protein
MINQIELNSGPLKKLIVEAGTDSPGGAFQSAIFSKLEKLSKTPAAYQPVISAMGWKFILAFILSIFFVVLFTSPADRQSTSLIGKLPDFKLPILNFSFPNFNLHQLDFSPPFLIGIIAFFILGFFVILATIRNKQAGI